MSTEYNLAAVRRLLLAAFTAEDLPRFCRDRSLLEPVCDRFGPRYGLDDMVDELLEYARTQRLLGELLAAVREQNPRQYAAFEAEITTSAGEAERASEAQDRRGILYRGRVLLVVLALDLAMLVLGLWFELGSRGRAAELWTNYFVIGLLTAAVIVLLTLGRPVGWGEVVRVLGTRRHWPYVVGLLTAACLYAVVRAYASMPPVIAPTAYIGLILDNGPVPDQHDFDELRQAMRAELEHALPNAALALYAFGAECGETRRLVAFRRGNAFEVAEEAGTVPLVAQSDLTGAVRQALDDLLAQPASQPRVLVVVTWGQDGCGGDLDEELARYRQWLGSAVSLSLIALGQPPAVAARPGVNVVQVDDAQGVREALRDIQSVLEEDTWSPRTPMFRVTPKATP